eukprot:Sdes_comp18973_c0_seq1m9511
MAHLERLDAVELRIPSELEKNDMNFQDATHSSPSPLNGSLEMKPVTSFYPSSSHSLLLSDRLDEKTIISEDLSSGSLHVIQTSYSKKKNPYTSTASKKWLILLLVVFCLLLSS